MRKNGVNMIPGNTSLVRDGFVPNPKLKLWDQVGEVMRFEPVFAADGAGVSAVVWVVVGR